jgi:hypothetical protein
MPDRLKPAMGQHYTFFKIFIRFSAIIFASLQSLAAVVFYPFYCKNRFFIMYTHIWLKYLPIVRILMKKSAASEQILNLNRPDFEKAGVARKAGYKFNIEYTNGKVSNVISTSQLALDLAAVMLEDAGIKPLLAANNYQISLNTKFQLTIKNTTPQEEVMELEAAAQEA